jgi:hypothetical protein
MILVLLLAILNGQQSKPIAFGSLKVVLPVDWKSEKPSNRLRSHQFRLPSGSPDFADAELIILPESKPDPVAVFPAWEKSFDPADGKTRDEVTRKSKKMLDQATIHLLDVTGTWNYRERPQDPKSKLEVRPEYRSIWLIVVSGDEAWHVRLSGPVSVIAKYEKSFKTAFRLDP